MNFAMGYLGVIEHAHLEAPEHDEFTTCCLNKLVVPSTGPASATTNAPLLAHLTSAPTASRALALFLASRLASFFARFRFVLESSSSSLPLINTHTYNGQTPRQKGFLSAGNTLL